MREAQTSPPRARGAPRSAPRVSAARERILATAHDLFYRDGVRATGVDRVIAQAGVTKVTFYRHFPGKDALVLAFLELRHAQWMAGFDAALRRHGGRVDALVPALREWFEAPAFRGCAFVNVVAELGDAVPGSTQAARRHKAAMRASIAALLPEGAARDATARALAVAVDGTIVTAQVDGSADAALDALARLVDAIAPAATRAGRSRPRETPTQASRAASR